MRAAVIAFVVFASLEARADDCEHVTIWRDGKRGQVMCRNDTVARGLTVIDLGDNWLPPILRSGTTGAGPGYAATYLALAQERFDDAGLDGELATRDRYLELFGIEPTFRVVRGRLADDRRHACHAAISDTSLASLTEPIAEESSAEGRARLVFARALRAELEHDRLRKKATDLAALAASGRYYRRALDRLTAIERRIAAVRAIQAHLACDGLASSMIAGAYTWQTSNALETFQRGAMILPSGIVDTATRDALVLDSRERDLRVALRVLRERVAAASGLIEDGTAGAGERTVLGRVLVPEATWRVRGHAPLPDAADDRISAATEAAARALGWRDLPSVRAFLDQLVSSEASMRLVAVELPALPAYHASAMELSVEIDRGDVWHDPRPRRRAIARRPALILYAKDGERRIPLVRWPTTIGGWQKQSVGGEIEKRWKESPVGPRIWRDFYVGPSWLPPVSTPDRELVRVADDRFVLAREQMGPSYHAAFGMVSFVHLAGDNTRDKVDYWDEGIRTHGTGNLVSLANGVSHGCHRLLGSQAVRLADFVLAHHASTPHGEAPTYYRRVVRVGTDRFPLEVDTLGYHIELDPPIPVEVLPGRIHQ